MKGRFGCVSRWPRRRPLDHGSRSKGDLHWIQDGLGDVAIGGVRQRRSLPRRALWINGQSGMSDNCQRLAFRAADMVAGCLRPFVKVQFLGPNGTLPLNDELPCWILSFAYVDVSARCDPAVTASSHWGPPHGT